MDTVAILLRMPPPLQAALDRRARRHRRSRTAELLVLLEWALRHMPEQLPQQDAD